MNDIFASFGNQNWNVYYSELEKIWILYNRYGRNVLKVDLGLSHGMYKEAFESPEQGDTAEFKKNIRKIWEDNYHHVISNYEELLNFCKLSEDVYMEETLYPEVEQRIEGETNGIDQPYSVNKDFFDEIVKKTENGNIFISDKLSLYELEYHNDKFSTCGKIIITKKKVIFCDLKE